MTRAPEWILVGMVKRIHGNEGELLIKPLTDRLERFDTGKELYLTKKREDERRSMTIAASRPSDRGPLVRFEGYNSRDEVWDLFGAELFVPASELAEPEPDAFYHFDLEGCEVFSGEKLVGTVTRVFESRKANPYLEVDPGGGEKPHYIPFVKVVVTGIDTEGGRIDIVEGFLG